MSVISHSSLNVPPACILILLCYSQILCGGSVKILDFTYFVLIWWQTDKKQEILKQSCKGLFIMDRTAIFFGLIIGSDNIFNMEVSGALAIYAIVHNLLTENRNMLKFWISDSYVDFYLFMK